MLFRSWRSVFSSEFRLGCLHFSVIALNFIRFYIFSSKFYMGCLKFSVSSSGFQLGNYFFGMKFI